MQLVCEKTMNERKSLKESNRYVSLLAVVKKLKRRCRLLGHFDIFVHVPNFQTVGTTGVFDKLLSEQRSEPIFEFQMLNPTSDFENVVTLE